MTAEETARKENRVVHSIVDSDTPPSCWFQVSETTYRRLSRDGYFRTPRSTKEEIAHAVSIDNGIISWSFYWFLHCPEVRTIYHGVVGEGNVRNAIRESVRRCAVSYP